MSKDDEHRRTGRLGQTLPGYSVLAEAFGAAIDGASRMTRTRAKQLAERLLNQAGLENVDLGEAASEAGARINQLAEEIMEARKANQALLQRTVAGELEKSLRRLGLAGADEVAALRTEIADLRHEVAQLTIASAGTAPTAGKQAAARKTARKSTATATAARTTPAKKAAAKKAAAKKAASKKTAAKKTAAKKSPGTPTTGPSA